MAAAEWVRTREPRGPFVVAGFSFGSLCALHASPRLSPDVLFLIGLPVDRVGRGRARSRPMARRLDSGRGRRVQPDTEVACDRGARGWSFVSVPGADHFFAGKLDAFERAAGDALEEALAVP